MIDYYIPVARGSCFFIRPVLYCPYEVFTVNIKADKRFPADILEIENVYSFISQVLSENGVEPAFEVFFKLAADEIFSNIVKYGYGNKYENKNKNEAPQAEAVIYVAIHVEDDSASMTFRDGGPPFNPLQARPPSLSLGLDERPVGGLGIYIVKNSFDEACYSFEDGFNIFTVKKLRRKTFEKNDEDPDNAVGVY